MSIDRNLSFCLLPVLPLLVACGSSTEVVSVDSAEQTGNLGSLAGFSQQIAETLGGGAVNCGTVGAGTMNPEVDQCIVDMFNASGVFYAVYEQAGIDSTVADGVSRDATGELKLWNYDSSITGQGDAGPAQVNNEVCKKPGIANPQAQSAIEKFGCYVSLAEFEQQMFADSGSDSIRCGTVEIDQSPQITDDCVVNAIADSNAFVALYMRRGIDSTVAEGLSGYDNGVTFHWSYDSSVTGQGDEGPSRVERTFCSALILNDSESGNGVASEAVLERFNCEN